MALLGTSPRPTSRGSPAWPRPPSRSTSSPRTTCPATTTSCWPASAATGPGGPGRTAGPPRRAATRSCSAIICWSPATSTRSPWNADGWPPCSRWMPDKTALGLMAYAALMHWPFHHPGCRRHPGDPRARSDLQALPFRSPPGGVVSTCSTDQPLRHRRSNVSTWMPVRCDHVATVSVSPFQVSSSPR